MKQIINDGSFGVLFGDKHDLAASRLERPVFDQQLDTLRQQLGCSRLVILAQIHSNKGYVVASGAQKLELFGHDGDYIITNQPSVGIGVLTGDCLPIVVLDKTNRSIGIAHAGWRGTVRNIIGAMIDRMHTEYGTTVDDIHVYFGPCAKVCCYQVQHDFLAHLSLTKADGELIIEREKRLLFDLIALNKIQLHAVGVPDDRIDTSYNECTICHERFYSYRRLKNELRQPTLVWIN